MTPKQTSLLNVALVLALALALTLSADALSNKSKVRSRMKLTELTPDQQVSADNLVGICTAIADGCHIDVMGKKTLDRELAKYVAKNVGRVLFANQDKFKFKIGDGAKYDVKKQFWYNWEKFVDFFTGELVPSRRLGDHCPFLTDCTTLVTQLQLKNNFFLGESLANKEAVAGPVLADLTGANEEAWSGLWPAEETRRTIGMKVLSGMFQIPVQVTPTIKLCTYIADQLALPPDAPGQVDFAKKIVVFFNSISQDGALVWAGGKKAPLKAGGAGGAGGAVADDNAAQGSGNEQGSKSLKDKIIEKAKKAKSILGKFLGGGGNFLEMEGMDREMIMLGEDIPEQVTFVGKMNELFGKTKTCPFMANCVQTMGKETLVQDIDVTKLPTAQTMGC